MGALVPTLSQKDAKGWGTQIFPVWQNPCGAYHSEPSATFTVSLPPAMAEQVEKARKAENRTRSELLREALRVYLSTRLVPTEKPTSAEARAYRPGVAAYKRGNYVTLEEYLDGMDRRPRRAGKKVS